MRRVTGTPGLAHICRWKLYVLGEDAEISCAQALLVRSDAQDD
jgi:hypothetical protein